MRSLAGILLLASLPFMALHCTSHTTVAGTGSGSETTNGCIMGSLTNADGTPASMARVTVIPGSYDPVRDGSLPAGSIDTTDGAGNYYLKVKDTGSYSIEAVHLITKTRLLVAGITVKYDTVLMQKEALQPVGSINVKLPWPAGGQPGYLYVPGTTYFVFVSNSCGYTVVDSLPSGMIPALDYAALNAPAPEVIRYNIEVTVGDTVTIINPAWKYSRQLFLNTTATGAGVASNVTNFPALVRLTAGNFNFSQALGNGGDIRFEKSDATPLAFEIEHWDSLNGQAEIWVKMDTVYGNNSTQSMVMYWGNTAAASISNSAAVFDTANGFQGVWHLAEAGNTVAYDATYNHYNGTPYAMSAASAVPGIIGIAQAFNGVSSYIAMPGTASGKLNFAANGTYALSAWVYADTLDTMYQQVMSKGDRQYGLQMHKITDTTWEMFEYENLKGWESVLSRATTRAWVYLTGIRSGGLEYLYVNGSLACDSITNISYDAAAADTCNVCIGRQADRPYRFWNGMMDEVRISSVAPGAAWIKLCYMNQKAQDALIVFE
jgi:hypothetical protein